jgi:hypothetical protein
VVASLKHSLKTKTQPSKAYILFSSNKHKVLLLPADFSKELEDSCKHVSHCEFHLTSHFTKQAREAVEMRAQVERKMAQKEKEKHEEKLREMAQKARERRAGIKTHVEKGMTILIVKFTL